ncbi:MAG: hypothetical protein ACTHMO_12525 [Rhodanobacteraceae bacterium]
MKLTINSEPTLQSVIGELRVQFRERKYLTVTIKDGKGRSLDQNAISHAWYEQVARELREDDARGVKRFCKLHFGVPILRAEDDEFREAYDASILRTLRYEQKLAAMDVIPVTSVMNTRQLSRYMEDVQAHYTGRVDLRFPETQEAA